MKILYHHRIASKDGQFVHVEELTNALREDRHQLYFVCPKFSDESDFGAEGGIATRLKRLLPRFVYELLELSYSLWIAIKLIAAVLKFRPDFIYERYNLYQPVGVIVGRLFGLPVLLEVNAPLVAERKKYSGLALCRVAKRVEDFTWRNATYVLPVTQVLAEHVIEAGVDAAKIVVIPNGINKGVLDKFDSYRAQSNVGGEITIGFTGFINPWHRLDLALDAIARIGDPKIKFLCVGEGDIRSELERQAKTLGISDQVVFTGLVSRDRVFDYVSRFDIALQPAVTAYASPLKLFEYMACGALIVAPDMPNIREVLSTNNAILFDPERPDDFKEALIDALKHFSQYAPKRQAARASIDEQGLTWQHNARRVIALVEDRRKAS